MEIQDAYAKMAEHLKEWIAQNNLLEAKVENVEADMTVKYVEELHE